MSGMPRRIASSQRARASPSGRESSAAARPPAARTAHNTSATTRRRVKPSARSAAISPKRWFTETVSRTVMRRKPKKSVTELSTVEIWRK